MESVFKKYDDYIIRAEYKTFSPESLSNINKVNKTTTFKIDGDFLNIKNAKYDISGSYLQTDGIQYPPDSNIRLVDNFIAYIFSNIEVKKNNTVIEKIENVGRASTIKGTVSYSNEWSGLNINSGFQSKYVGGGKFQAVGNLSNLCLGFFKDIKYPIFKGGIEINFIRNSDDDVICRNKNKGNDKTPVDGKVIIDDFTIRIPLVEYEEISKIKLLNELEKLSQEDNYRLQFKSWQCIETRNLTGKTFKKDTMSEYRNINNPLFAIVAFQTDLLDNQLKDPSGFDHCNVKNIWIELEGRRYPEEMLNLDFKNDKYGIIYDMFSEYKKVFNKTNQEVSLMYVDPTQFKNSRAVYVINLTRQPENISESRHNFVLHVDFNEDVPQNTVCYICLVSSIELVYDINKNRIKQIV